MAGGSLRDVQELAGRATLSTCSGKSRAATMPSAASWPDLTGSLRSRPSWRLRHRMAVSASVPRCAARNLAGARSLTLEVDKSRCTLLARPFGSLPVSRRPRRTMATRFDGRSLALPPLKGRATKARGGPYRHRQLISIPSFASLGAGSRWSQASYWA